MPDYITLAEAKAWLGLDTTTPAQEALISDLITAVSEAIDDHTETTFGTPIVITNEIHDARRQDIVIPKGWPLISVQALKLNVNADGSGGAALATTDYQHDDVEIRFRELSMPQQRGYIRIDYTYGYATVPAKVKLATKIGVEGYYRQRARQSVGITSKSKEGESINYKSSWDSKAGLPKEAVALLEGYQSIEWPSGPGGEMATRNR